METTGQVLRRLAKSAKSDNAWSKPYMRAALPWQPSTAWKKYDVRAFGGFLWACFQAGTGGTTQPDATQVWVATDSGTYWVNVGVNLVTQDPFTTQSNWAASTAYSLADQRINNGNVYACIIAGTSASSGGPTTQTTSVITDGTVTWTYLGKTYVNPYAAIMPKYTATTGGTPSGYGNLYNPQSTLGQSVFALRGCYYGTTSSTDYMTLLTFTPTTGATPTSHHYAIEFYTDAPKFYIKTFNGNQRFQIFIDNNRYFAGGVDSASTTTYFQFDFTSAEGRKKRLIRIESTTAYDIGTIGVDSQSSVWKPDDLDKVTCAVLGDSIWDGSNNHPFWIANTASLRLGHEMGWNDVWSFTQGGTGPANRGSSPGITTDNFQFRIPEAVTRNPDVWVVMASSNDVNTGLSYVAPAITNILNLIRGLGSKAPIIVAGIWSFNDTASPWGSGNHITDYESAVSGAVAAWNDPLDSTFFIPVRNDPVCPWVTGSWNNTLNTNSTNATTFVNSTDNLHPTDQGVGYLSQKLGTAIRELVLPNLE